MGDDEKRDKINKNEDEGMINLLNKRKIVLT